MNENIKQNKYLSKEVDEIVLAWQSSGKTKKRFAEEHGIKYFTFIEWTGKRNFKRTRDKNFLPQNNFIPLTIPPTQTVPNVEVITKSGNKVIFYQSLPVELLERILSC